MNNASTDNTVQVNGAELGELVILTDEVVASGSVYSDESYVATVMVDESIREEDGSDNEEKSEDIENRNSICQLLNQRMASQR